MSRNTSMLVVSNRVYAKREEDGALHPGLVESKQEDCYTVKFADETRCAFLEKDLVWIGFWGLPSSCWPEYPVIQTTVLGTVQLDDKIRSMANKVTDRESKEPALFTVDEISESDESLSESSSSSVEDSQSVNKLDYNGSKQLHPIQMCASSERTRSPRPSVLRLNTGLLHKDSPHSHLLSSSPRKEATETVEILPHLSPSIQENLENNDSKFKSKFLIEREDRSCLKNTSSFAAERTSPDSKFLLTTKFANNSDESLWSLTRREMENQMNTRHLSLNPDAAWYSRDWSEAFPLNRSNLTPSIIPLISAKYFSQEPPLFRELYETLSRKGPLITDNTELFNEGQKKRKRSDDTKKCRKVYGVDNRHAWCTQCRWKKACARFGD